MYTSESPSGSYESNITWCLLKRQQNCLSYKEQRTILLYGVYQTTHTRRATPCKFQQSAVSTFFMAFSPNGETVASGHGDHTVRICDVKSGCCLHTLKGHPRSPWCVVFHPSYPHLLASGCLKGIVNVWDLKERENKLISSRTCFSVTSLAFHPTDMVLLIATGNQLLFWAWHQNEPFAIAESASVHEKIRLVKFDAFGSHILTGIHDTSPLVSDGVRDKVDCQVREMSQTIRTSVVHIERQNMRATVKHVITEGVPKHSRRKTGTLNQNGHLVRLQWWDATEIRIPNIKQRNLNVIVHNCKLFNDLGADISADGQFLSALVVKLENNTELCMVCVFSLQKGSIGHCLYSTVVDHNSLCVSFSPLSCHLLVGLAWENRVSLFQDEQESTTTMPMAYIFKLYKKTNFSTELPAATLKFSMPTDENTSNLKANVVVWHPVIGYGLIACGTNRGEVYFCHV
ncbi:activating molecule in BECN1-regulated autophagy protein 1-like [Dendronephthya gigantea]|uniref:activating molecule in BECN1-regulated autophagy protein 1-like n=1 Tax=Dendronephthya gigantea TaxID=151771 RepID=UPI00106B3093|nr:activating molecule in BECN1-regulated autophagy protein 1-like [Dendronephthya gigantea]